MDDNRRDCRVNDDRHHHEPKGARRRGNSLIEKIALYDPAAIRAGLRETDDDDIDGFVGLEDERPSAPPASYSTEEGQWRRTLLRIAKDPRGPLREILVGSSEMAADVADLDLVAPHFADVTRLIRRAVIASTRTKTRLRFPPLLLVGPPGIGKTFYARRLAQALGRIHLVEIAVNMMNDRGRLTGYSMAWKGARIGDLALGVLAAGNVTSSPLFYFDEIEKVAPREKLHDVFLSVFETENARRFTDEYLTSIATLRLDHALVIATANDVSPVPAPVLDRMLVVHVEAPAGENLRAVIRSIYAAVVATYGSRFAGSLDPSVLAHLETMTPRLLKKTLDIAIPFALEAGRWRLTVSDLTAAAAITEANVTYPVGFVR